MDRRAFLGWAATGAAGLLLLPAIVRPKPKVFDMGRGPSRIAGPRCVRQGLDPAATMDVEYGYERPDGSTLWVPRDRVPATDRTAAMCEALELYPFPKSGRYLLGYYLTASG